MARLPGGRGEEPAAQSTEPDYADLPRDPEQAFLQLERQFRMEREGDVRKAHQDESVNIYYVNYIASVLATIKELKLESEFNDRVPTIEETTYQTYLEFSKDVRYYRTRLEIRHGRRIQGYSVHFDANTKQRL